METMTRRLHSEAMRRGLATAERVLVIADGAGSAAAREWVRPLLRKVRENQAPAVIGELKELLPTLTEAQVRHVHTTVEYYKNHLHRMKYAEAAGRHKPVGWGTIEPKNGSGCGDSSDPQVEPKAWLML